MNRWQLRDSRAHCQACGEMAQPLWVYWISASTWTDCLCEACAEKGRDQPGVVRLLDVEPTPQARYAHALHLLRLATS